MCEQLQESTGFNRTQTASKNSRFQRFIVFLTLLNAQVYNAVGIHETDPQITGQ
jgi:hypothetical protein